MEAILLLIWWVIYTAILSEESDDESSSVTEKNSLDKILVQVCSLSIIYKFNVCFVMS